MTKFFTSDLLKSALAIAFCVSLSGTGHAQNTAYPSRTGLRPLTGTLGLPLKNPSGSHARISAVVSRPGVSQDYSPVPGGSWQLETKSTYTYDAAGRMTQRLYTDPVTNQNLQREVFSYYPQGAEMEFRTEDWVNNAWVTMEGGKSLNTYNSQGKITESVFQQYNASTNTWENTWREQTTYDAAGLITEINNSEWDNNAWQPLDRVLVTNPNGIGSGLLVQEFDGSTWEDLFRSQNMVWHEPFETPAAYTMQAKDNNTWVNMEKYSSIYDANGGHVGVYQEWEPANNTWVNSFRETETIDSNKNYTRWLNEGWDPAGVTWVNQSEDQEVLTYSGIDVTHRIFRDSYNMTSTLKDTRKEEYSNFQTFNVSGVKDQLAEADVMAFPNPAGAMLHVSLPALQKDLTATLIDVTGKTLLTRHHKNTNGFELGLENLPKGLYLLRLETGTQTLVKRIVKD